MRLTPNAYTSLMMNQATLAARDGSEGFSPTRCGRCGDEFGCGVKAATPCWCASLPTLVQIDPAVATCLCPACLARALAAQVDQ